MAERTGEQGHAAAVLHSLQLAGVPGQDYLPAAGLGVADQVGQVRAGHRRGLIDHQQRRLAGFVTERDYQPKRERAISADRWSRLVAGLAV